MFFRIRAVWLSAFVLGSISLQQWSCTSSGMLFRPYRWSNKESPRSTLFDWWDAHISKQNWLVCTQKREKQARPDWGGKCKREGAGSAIVTFIRWVGKESGAWSMKDWQTGVAVDRRLNQNGFRKRCVSRKYVESMWSWAGRKNWIWFSLSKTSVSLISVPLQLNVTNSQPLLSFHSAVTIRFSCSESIKLAPYWTALPFYLCHI